MSHSSVTLDVFDCHADAKTGQTELLIVEGESAWRTVIALRDASFQAVLPMQGKPINATRRTRAAVMKNPWVIRLIQTIVGVDHAEEMVSRGGTFRITTMRYDRIVLLFDPDADGIHCGGLLTALFATYLSAIIDAERLWIVRPPLYVIRGRTAAEVLHLHNDEQLSSARRQLEAADVPHQVSRYRGLANIEANVICRTCLNQQTRTASIITQKDAEAFQRIFGRSTADR